MCELANPDLSHKHDTAARIVPRFIYAFPAIFFQRYSVSSTMRCLWRFCQSQIYRFGLSEVFIGVGLFACIYRCWIHVSVCACCECTSITCLKKSHKRNATLHNVLWLAMHPLITIRQVTYLLFNLILCEAETDEIGSTHVTLSIST